MELEAYSDIEEAYSDLEEEEPAKSPARKRRRPVKRVQENPGWMWSKERLVTEEESESETEMEPETESEPETETESEPEEEEVIVILDSDEEEAESESESEPGVEEMVYEMWDTDDEDQAWEALTESEYTQECVNLMEISGFSRYMVEEIEPMFED